MAAAHMNEAGVGTPSLPLFCLVFACAKNLSGKRPSIHYLLQGSIKNISLLQGTLIDNASHLFSSLYRLVMMMIQVKRRHIPPLHCRIHYSQVIDYHPIEKIPAQFSSTGSVELNVVDNNLRSRSVRRLTSLCTPPQTHHIMAYFWLESNDL
jgi:hypothetical protein